MACKYYNIRWYESEGCYIFEYRYLGLNSASRNVFLLKFGKRI